MHEAELRVQEVGGTATARAVIRVPAGAGRFEAPPLVLPEGQVIRGRILAAGQQPVAGIRVHAFAECARPAPLFAARSLVGFEETRTAADGSFELRGLESCGYTIRVVGPGPHVRVRPPELAGFVPGLRDLEFRLER
jgi:hypothetical protein